MSSSRMEILEKGTWYICQYEENTYRRISSDSWERLWGLTWEEEKGLEQHLEEMFGWAMKRLKDLAE